MTWLHSGLTHTCLYVEKFFVRGTFRSQNEQNRTTNWRKVTSWYSYNTKYAFISHLNVIIIIIYYPEVKCISLRKICSPIWWERVGKLYCVKNVCVSRMHPFLVWFPFSQDVKHITNFTLALCNILTIS